jgi:hypothetical protein
MSLRAILAGALVAAATLASPASAAGADDVAGWCTFTGTTTPDGLLQFAYGGHAVATSTSGLPPTQTVLTCTIESPAQGLPGESPTLTHSVTAGSPGAAVAVAETTPPWPVRPVRVCASGYAIFGPVDPLEVAMAEECRWATL